jgi:hypothetical protein
MGSSKGMSKEWKFKGIALLKIEPLWSSSLGPEAILTFSGTLPPLHIHAHGEIPECASACLMNLYTQKMW